MSKAKRAVSIQKATAINPVLLYVNYDVTGMPENHRQFLLSELHERGAVPPYSSFFAGFFDTEEEAELFAETEFPKEIEVISTTSNGNKKTWAGFHLSLKSVLFKGLNVPKLHCRVSVN